MPGPRIVFLCPSFLQFSFFLEQENHCGIIIILQIHGIEFFMIFFCAFICNNYKLVSRNVLAVPRLAVVNNLVSEGMESITK